MESTFFSSKGEIFEKTKERLQLRTGIKGKPFEKIKFALVRKSNTTKLIYLLDGERPLPLRLGHNTFANILDIEDILADVALESDDVLELDHVDKNSCT